MTTKSDPVLTYTIRCEASLLAKLKVIAQKNRRSMNNEFVFRLEQVIESFEKEHGPINVDPDE